MSSNALSGTLPDALFALTGLAYCELGNNAFNGTLPSSLGSQKSLTYVLLVVVCLTFLLLPFILRHYWGVMWLVTVDSVLGLERNQLSGSLPSLSNSTSLTSVHALGLRVLQSVTDWMRPLIASPIPCAGY